ncbi:MAG TPA: diacylglyceryl transferase [Planctomycetes bacterium]|nr:diacylglyceryl transferase [Planctomycetota bacterium]
MGGTLPELYPLVMMLAVGTGAVLSRRYKATLPISTFNKVWIGLSAFSGAILTAKLPFLIPGLPGFTDAEGLLISGKTILFGMVGGYFGVELAKRSIGLKMKTGDTFVVPVAVSIAIGRLACFCGGCCYGTPTNLPWAVTFPSIDHLTRHPTQLYESAFHLVAAVVAAGMIQRRMLQGQLIKLYFISYFCYRFLTEFIRPEALVVGGLTAYQWSAIVFIPLFAWLWRRDAMAFLAAKAQSPGLSK